MARSGRDCTFTHSDSRPFRRSSTTIVVLFGIAVMLIALLAGISGAWAQGAYGVGGYLERPEQDNLPEDGADTGDGTASQPARRPVRRQRTEAEAQGQQRPTGQVRPRAARPEP